ncbi:MAG: Gfo/Idh/MocA family oxidoreductase [Acidobacteria bacterium]|nr:Gfo/Idh/MocA family oxidoreductase [Acidobacteriota bacterium]MDA1233163.1 Gfo/Idh/MocA family oxidoreductase [Acidobacteriota bacterium]
MKVGLIGTGAIAHKHAQAYGELGYKLSAAANRNADKGRAYAEQYGAEFCADWRDLVSRADIDYVDVCTFPDSHLEIVRECAAKGRSVLLQKPMDLTLEACREMIRLAQEADIRLGVVSQHRFNDSTIFLKKALADGRLGRLIQADGYAKWHRPQSYYDRSGKGTWEVEGGGALINQGIHTVDVVMYLAGRARSISANWQLATAHDMEAEDVVNALLTFEGGATGVIQASTACWPGYPERIELHGTKGSALIEGDRLIRWDVQDDPGDDAPLEAADEGSGASDPMAIPIENLKRNFADFGQAVVAGSAPLIDGQEGLAALEIVLGVYQAARSGQTVRIG